MNKSTLITGIIMGIAGFFLGGKFGKNLLNPTPKFAETTLVNAHNLSVGFRNHENYCIKDANGKITISPNSLGFSVMSINMIEDLKDAVQALVKKDYKEGKTPTDFRLITGFKKATEIGQTDVTNLMVVPIIDGVDIVKDKDGKDVIQILDYIFKCPVNCDIKESSVIMGTSGECTNDK